MGRCRIWRAGSEKLLQPASANAAQRQKHFEGIAGVIAGTCQPGHQVAVELPGTVDQPVCQPVNGAGIDQLLHAGETVQQPDGKPLRINDLADVGNTAVLGDRNRVDGMAAGQQMLR